MHCAEGIAWDSMLWKFSIISFLDSAYSLQKQIEKNPPSIDIARDL